VPGLSERYVSVPDRSILSEQTAIILQGPVYLPNRFTVETVKIYRKLYPCARIIVSTWDSIDRGILADLESTGALIVTQPLPSFKSVGNLNYQTRSTQLGLKAARDHGAKFALKTRTDQRICLPDALTFLHNLMRAFPAPAGSKQNTRLIALAENTYLYRLYAVSDHLLFGTLEDVENYWSLAEETRPNISHFPDCTLAELARLEFAETKVLLRYLEKMNHAPNYSLGDSHAVIRDMFCLVDAAMLHLLWPKYSNTRLAYPKYFNPPNTDDSFSFGAWLKLQSRSLVNAESDRILGLRMGENIPRELIDLDG
jgi:hypothetical protein